MASPQNFVSVTRRQPDIEDYIDMLRRYRSWVIGPTFAGLVIAVVAAFLYPDTYESRAVMRIIPPTVPTSLVEGVGMPSMAQRLEQMQVQILGRTSLMEIIQKPALDLYKKERARITLDEVAERMRLKDIHIKLYEPSGGATAKGAQAFEIRFGYSDRFKAQQVVREITGLFQEYNFSLQHTQATATASFLTDELKKAQDRMNTAQQAVAQFSAQHPGELPQDAGYNTAAASNKASEIRSLEESMGRTQEQKYAAEIQLQNLKLMENTAAGSVEQTFTTAPEATLRNDRLLQIEKDINDANGRLATLRMTYKDDYPDVLTAKKIISQLETRRAEVEKSEIASQRPAAGPQIRTVRDPAAQQHLQELQVNEKTVEGQIANSNSEMARQKNRLDAANKDLQILQARVAASPQLLQQYNDLQAELTLARQAYDAKSKVKDQSETAQNLEEHHDGETLELLETADLPETPAEPNRWAIVGLGTFIGMLAGFGLAGAKELKNTSLKNLKDVRAYTNLPVLSSVPLLENALLVRRKRRLAWLAWSSAIVIGGFLMSGAAYYYLSGNRPT